MGTDDTRSEAMLADVDSVLGILSIAFFWSGFYLTMFSGVVLMPIPAELRLEPLFRETCIVAMAVTFLLFVAVRKRTRPEKIAAVSRILVCVAAPWPHVLALSVESPFPGLAGLGALAWALYGMAAACLTAQTSFVIARLNKRDATFAVGVAVSLGALLYLIGQQGTGALSLIGTAALPYLSVACMRRSRRPPAQDGSAPSADESGVASSLAASLRTQPAQPFYGMIFGLAIGVGISVSTLQSDRFPFEVAAAICLAGPALITMAAFASRLDIADVQWLLMPLAIVGILPLTLGVEPVTHACCAALAFCFAFYELTHTLSLTDLMDGEQCSGVELAAGKFVTFAGTAIGWGLSYLLLISGNYFTTLFSTVLIVLACLMTLVIAYMGRPSQREATSVVVVSNKEEASSMGLDEICELISKRAELSPKQTEVLGYLAKGRNASSIAEKLVVSNHTVKAHIYRIYQKLDIHSQQELIDLVEKELTASESMADSARS